MSFQDTRPGEINLRASSKVDEEDLPYLDDDEVAKGVEDSEDSDSDDEE